MSTTNQATFTTAQIADLIQATKLVHDHAAAERIVNARIANGWSFEQIMRNSYDSPSQVAGQKAYDAFQSEEEFSVRDLRRFVAA